MGSVLWVAYGVHLEDIIIMTVNSVIISFNVLILFLKRKYSRERA
jgi:hypothetical protein